MPTARKTNTKNQSSGTSAREASPEPLLLKKDKLYLALVIVLFAAANANGLKAQLTFDDHNALTKNKVTHTDAPWMDIFFHDFWGHRLTDISSNDSFRPLTVLTFKVQYFLLGAHSAPFLRLFNYLLAAVNIVLIYYASRILTYLLLPKRDIPLAVKDKIEDDHVGRLRALLERIPLCTAALFAVHPVHVEAVTSIVGRSELICAALGFGAFILLHLYTQRHTKAPLAAALLLLSLSVFGKESGVTFGAMFVVYFVILIGLKRVCWKSATGAIVLLCTFVFAYVHFRKHFIGHVDLSRSPLIRRTENPQYFAPPGLLNWWSMRWVVLMKNLELSFLPTKLNCEYSFNCIPHMDSLTDARFIPFCCVTLFFVTLGLTLLYRCVARRSHVSSAFLLCLLWYGISLSPVTHIFVKVGTFVAERCLYIPSFTAVYLVAGGLLFWAGGRGTAARMPPVVAVLVCLAIWWTWLTVRRNEDWYDDEHLFASNMRACPASGKAHYQVGLSMAVRKGAVDEEARALMEKAVTLDDDLYEPYIYLALADFQNRNYSAAHDKARQCAAHPITAERCANVYQAVRKVLFPNWKNYETLLDLAEASSIARIGARTYRMAGLAALQEADKATAASILHKSLTAWQRDADVDPWMEGWEEPLGDSNYCNTLYWYTHTYASAVLSGSQRIDSKALENFVQELVHGCERCRKRWSAGRVLTAKDALVPSYQKCLNDYNTVAEEALTTLLSITSHPNTTAHVQQAAREASVEVALMQVCNIAEVSDDASSSRQLRALQRLFPQNVAFIQRYFANNKEMLIENVRKLIFLAKEKKPLDEQTRRHWSDLASCSQPLSRLLRQDLA